MHCARETIGVIATVDGDCSREHSSRRGPARYRGRRGSASSKNALEREIERRNRLSRATRNIPHAATAAAPLRRSIVSYLPPRIRDRFRSKDRDGVTSRFTRPGSINRNVLLEVDLSIKYYKRVSYVSQLAQFI